jgi:hypothetical protein
MKGNEAFGHEIIKKLQEKNPSWKMNVKFDNDRQKIQRNPKSYPNINMPYPPQNNPSYPPYPTHMQRQPYHNYMHPHPGNMQQQTIIPSVSEKIVGMKPCRIFVRELWLGGIP